MTTFSPFSILLKTAPRTHCSASIFPRLEPLPQKHASYITILTLFTGHAKALKSYDWAFKNRLACLPRRCCCPCPPPRPSPRLDFAAACLPRQNTRRPLAARQKRTELPRRRQRAPACPWEAARPRRRQPPCVLWVGKGGGGDEIILTPQHVVDSRHVHV